MQTQLDLSRLAGMPLGTIIARSGLVAPEDVEHAIKESVATGRRLGQVLVARGLLSADQLAQLLAVQGRSSEEISQPAPQKQLVRRIYRDGAPFVTLRCHPRANGCAVDYEVHSNGRTQVETRVFSSRDAGYAFVEETSDTFRLLGCETSDEIADEPRSAA
jgi:hypothetical protein